MQLSLFDYSQLNESNHDYVHNRTERIHELVKRSAQDIIDIGGMLIDVKDVLEHGQFLNWLACEFDWSDQTARNLMHVHERFGQNQNVFEFAPTVLYLLAAPSTPDEAVEEVFERAEHGETITHKKVRETIERHTPRTPPDITPKVAPSNSHTGTDRAEILEEFWNEPDDTFEFASDAHADDDWNAVPEIIDLLKNMRLVSKTLIPQIVQAIEIKKASPEARQFIRRELMSWNAQLQNTLKRIEEINNDE